jgi:hypothetical protein
MTVPASGFVLAGFIVLPLLVAAGFVLACEWAGRRLGHDPATRRRRFVVCSIGVIAWLGISALLATSGVLRRFDLTPPPFVLVPLVVTALGIGIPVSPLGTLLARGLPLWALVGSQVFRFPLELVMHQAAVEGVMPVQMSYSGWNFDIVTGITAGALGFWLATGRPPRWLVTAWNGLGFLLLLNVVTIALVSTPIFRWFGDARLSSFLTYAPFVWLPAILVTAALMGHILVWRATSAPHHP